MRVAIQLFGHLRSYKYTKKFLLKNIVEYNRKFGIEFDIFIHSWDEKDSKNNASYKKSKRFLGKKFLQQELDNIKKFYGAKEVSITPQLEISEEDLIFSSKNKIDPDLIHRNKNLSYSIQSVNNLRETFEKNNKIQYDLVILTRPDIMFIKGLKLNSFANNIVFPKTQVSEEYLKDSVCSSYIIFSDIYNGAIIDSKNYICGIDLFLITTPSSASVISSWFNNLQKYSNLWPEFAITKIINDNNLRHHYISYEKDKHWMILRNNFYYTFLNIFYPIRFLFDLMYIMIAPLLLFSLRYRQMIMLNPHYLDSNRLKKLLRFFFPKS